MNARPPAPMRLLVVSTEFPGMLGGVADYTLRLGQALVAEGQEIHVLTSARPEVAPKADLVVHARMDGWGPLSTLRLFRECREVAPDQILIQYVPYMYSRRGIPLHLIGAFLLHRWLVRTPLVLVCHELFAYSGRLRHRLIGILQKLLLRVLARFSDAVVVTTDRRRAWLVSNGFEGSRIHVIRVGTNIPPPSTDLRADTNAPSRRPFRVVMFGRLDLNRRRPDLVCEAVRRLAATAPDPVIELVLIGPVPLNTRSFLAEMPLEGAGYRVRREGMLPEGRVTELLGECDVAVAFETTGLGGVSTRSTACVGLLAAGLPLVGNRGGDTDTIFQDQVNVLFCEMTPEDLLAKLALLRSDRALRTRLSHGALDLFREELSWTHIAKLYLALCRSLQPPGLRAPQCNPSRRQP